MIDDASYRFSIIPGWIVTDPRLKGRDLQVLCLLGRHTNKTDGWCRRSQVKMAAQLDCSRSTVQASLNRLVDMGAIEQRVVTSPDGRDSAHRYRVIYDREADSVANSAWDEEDAEENIPMDGAENGTPPAGISAGGAGPESAPPADPESAPPADPESAPINDSHLTTPSNHGGIARARDAEEEENPKALERRFRAWWSSWPSYAFDDEAKTRRAWQALTPQQRKDCEEKTPAYLEWVKTLGRTKAKAGSTYLAERAWERLADGDTSPVARAGITQPAKPDSWAASYSREHAARYFRILLAGPDKPELAPSSGMWFTSQMRAAWPRLFAFWQQSDLKGGLVVTAADQGLGDLMEFVPAETELMDSWRQFFRSQGWPEPRVMTSGAFFPKGGPEALTGYERAARSMTGARGDDDAA